MIITSVQNEKIKEYAKLKQKKYRDKNSLFIIEGIHLLEEANEKKIIKEIISSDHDFKFFDYKITYVSSNVIEKLSSTDSPQNIITICHKIKQEELTNKMVALDNIQDAGNLGTIMRNALAFGFKTLIVNGVDIYNPKVIRSSQGSIFHLNLIQVSNLREFIEAMKNEYEIVGTLLDKDAKEVKEISKKEKMIIVFGNEGNGISQEVIETLDQKVYIKINFESLNVSAASAIVLNELKEVE